MRGVPRMLLLRRPSPDRLRDFLAEQSGLAFAVFAGRGGAAR
jgi:hypothetical protein